MNRLGIMFVGTLLAATLCYGQASSAPSQATPAAIGHGAFPVKVTKTLDSSKLKEGDSIEVETAGSFKIADGTLVTKGSKLEGKVVSSKSRSKGDADSELTLSFDKLNIANGKQLSVKGTVQAVFPPAEEQMAPNMATAGTSAGGSGAGGSPGGVGLTNPSAGADTQSSTSHLVMNPNATGVQGVHDLQLEDGVLSSKGKQVKLGSGVRMVVHVDILG